MSLILFIKQRQPLSPLLICSSLNRRLYFRPQTFCMNDLLSQFGGSLSLFAQQPGVQAGAHEFGQLGLGHVNCAGGMGAEKTKKALFIISFM